MRNLLMGKTHRCHTTEQYACRGGRDHQLTIWFRLGFLREPTDETLAEKIEEQGRCGSRGSSSSGQ